MIASTSRSVPSVEMIELGVIYPGGPGLPSTMDLPTEYGQRSPTGTGIAFDVAGGQRVNLRLTAWPTSGISGRVVDADGDPVGRDR